MCTELGGQRYGATISVDVWLQLSSNDKTGASAGLRLEIQGLRERIFTKSKR